MQFYVVNAPNPLLIWFEEHIASDTLIAYLLSLTIRVLDEGGFSMVLIKGVKASQGGGGALWRLGDA
jgi:hypothetical protein